MMDFIDNLFVVDANQSLANDIGVEQPNSSCGNVFLSKLIFNVVRGIFDFLIQEDYFDPCAYGNDVDEEVNFNVDGDDDDEINHHFKDLNPWELENVKASGCHHKIQSKIWATNAFDACQKYKKMDILLSIAKLHASKPKLFVNYFLEFLL
jgi:hypothetical protein